MRRQGRLVTFSEVELRGLHKMLQRYSEGQMGGSKQKEDERDAFDTLALPTRKGLLSGSSVCVNSFSWCFLSLKLGISSC